MCLKTLRRFTASPLSEPSSGRFLLLLLLFGGAAGTVDDMINNAILYETWLSLDVLKRFNYDQVFRFLFF
jgi:hypothetical protein